jgi:hypothetical protein
MRAGNHLRQRKPQYEGDAAGLMPPKRNGRNKATDVLPAEEWDIEDSVSETERKRATVNGRGTKTKEYPTKGTSNSRLSPPSLDSDDASDSESAMQTGGRFGQRKPQSFAEEDWYIEDDGASEIQRGKAKPRDSRKHVASRPKPPGPEANDPRSGPPPGEC